MNDTESKTRDAPALFIFVPFCQAICTYCDFNVYARQQALFQPYVASVVREIERTRQELGARLTARSLAFGGGTPSILSADQLGTLINAVRGAFELAPGAELTIEANPGTVDLAKLEELKQLGVNRLSLGVQTFDEVRLKAMNRHHSAGESLEAYELARRAGFDNINLDLIFGWPGSTLEDWQRTLEQALALEPEHLSLYSLQVEERTVLARQIELGRMAQPDADVAADLYEWASERLDKAGYRHYEISNWARPGHESQHNLTYWLNEPYLGFGAGAHSSFGGERYENVRHPREYIARIERGEKVVAARQRISRAMSMYETMILGLRLDRGVDVEAFRERYDEDPRELYAPVIRTLVEWDLLRVADGRLFLTPRGRLVSNQVLWRFMPDEMEK